MQGSMQACHPPAACCHPHPRTGVRPSQTPFARSSVCASSFESKGPRFAHHGLSQPCRVQPPDNSSISRLQGVRDEAAKPPSRLVGRTRSGILDRSSTSIGSNFASIVAIVASCRLSPEPTQPGEGSDVTHKAPRLHVVHHTLQHLALVFTRRYGATGVRPRPCVQC